MRRLLAVVLVLLLLAAVVAVADLVLTGLAEAEVAERVSEELGAPAEVELSGWPVTLRVLAGTGVPRVDVRADDVPVGAGSLDRLHVRLQDVALDVGDLRTGMDDLPPARSARFEAEVSEESIQRMLALPAELAGISLTPEGARLDLAGIAVVEASIVAEDGVVVLSPESPVAALLGLGRVPLDLSGAVGSPYVEAVHLDEGSLVLEGRLRAVETAAG